MQALPRGMSEQDSVHVSGRGEKRRRTKRSSRHHASGSKRHPDSKGRDWILKKKELRRMRGYQDVPLDTKYTGRKRKNLGGF